MSIQDYVKNRNRFPADDLERYAGRFVAWSPDATSILASGDDWGQVFDAVQASPHDPAECVIEWIPQPDELLLGGGIVDCHSNPLTL